MASDLLLGFVLGALLVGFALPMKGIVFTILEQRKEIESFRGSQLPSQLNDSEFPNRKENS